MFKRSLGILLALVMLLLPVFGLAEITVTGADGAQVTLESAPQRIVALPVWAGEMLLDMVETERIVGLSAWGDDPLISATADKAAQVKARVASSDLESLIALSPDLVVLDTFSDYDGSMTKTLKDAGVSVLTLSSPTTFEAVAECLLTLGEATGEPENARRLADGMNAELLSVSQAVAAVPEGERVRTMYYEDYYDATGASAGMLCAYGEGSTFQALCEAAGVVNVCDAPLYSAVSKEKIVGEWKPELLIVPGLAYGADFSTVFDGGEAAKAGILADAALSSVPAVQTGRIVALTECYRSSTSHYMAKAVRELAQAAYPQLFE